MATGFQTCVTAAAKEVSRAVGSRATVAVPTGEPVVLLLLTRLRRRESQSIARNRTYVDY